MAKEEDILEGLDKEEDLFDFDLEDITPEDLAEAVSGSDSDVIELVDLVEEGSGDQALGDEEGLRLVEEDDSQEAIEDISISTDEISAIPDILEDMEAREEEAGESVAEISLSDLELGDGPEEPYQAEEAASEDAFENAQTRAIKDLDIGEGVVVKEERPEVEIDLSGLFDEGSIEEPEEDLEAPTESEDSIEAILEETIEETVAEEEIASEELEPEPVLQVDSVPAEPEAPVAPAGWSGISEERIEAIVSEVVREVVERVARETMARVAERVITDAIEALKKSLESSSE